MKSTTASVLALAIAALAASPLSHAQQTKDQSTSKKFPYKVIYSHPSRPQRTPEERELIKSQSAASQTIPLWNYSTVAAQDGKTYTGTMVGRSPFAHGHRITTLTTYLVPVILTFQDTGHVFDPTTYDGCAPANENIIQLVQNSPLIKPRDFTMNGVDVGTGQYLDDFQRGNFWAKVGGTPYHTTFTTNPTVLSPLRITVPSSDGVTYSFSGECSPTGPDEHRLVGQRGSDGHLSGVG